MNSNDIGRACRCAMSMFGACRWQIEAKPFGVNGYVDASNIDMGGHVDVSKNASRIIALSIMSMCPPTGAVVIDMPRRGGGGGT